MKSSHSPVKNGFPGLGKHRSLSRVLEVLERENETKGLILAVYQLEEERFLYFNKPFKTIVGSKSERFLDQGWNFWFSNVPCNEAPRVKNRVWHFLSESGHKKPFALKYHFYDGNNLKLCVQHEIVLYRWGGSILAINYLFDVSGKERIERILKPTNSCASGKNGNRTDSISPREKEVLTLIGDGYSSKQIADMLYISNHTAISHRKNLIEKFQVRNTAQLIRNASQVMQL